MWADRRSVVDDPRGQILADGIAVEGVFAEVDSPSLTQDLARPELEAAAPAFEARMLQRARWRSIKASGTQRAFDVVVASAALVTVAPVILAVAAAVRFTSRGPAIFKQTRVGRNGRSFECLKFRTMVTHAESQLIEILKNDPEARAAFQSDFKLGDDPRITRIGRVLRRSSLDELPQLINVLRGEMSIVGPRPVVPQELGRYGDFAQVVLQVRPGMTGPWQVGGRSAIPYMERVRLDVEYALHRTLADDISIVRRTARCVVRPGSMEAR